MKKTVKAAIRSDKAPAPIGPYSQAVRVGDLVFVSGQVPLDPATGEMIDGDIASLTRRCMDSVLGILESAGLDASHIVKTNVYLADMGEFPAMNEAYGSYFENAEIPPARAAVQPARLPKDARIEIEVIAAD
jgi:2-iminobutanoate/2-iminopropanoate deaminase